MTSEKMMNEKMEQLKNVLAVNAEGINFSAMNAEENFLPYAYLLVCDERVKNEARQKAVKESLESMPVDKECDRKMLLNKKTLRLESEELKERMKELENALCLFADDNGVVTAPIITPLSATWAFSKGTQDYANLLEVANSVAIEKSIAKIHDNIKQHLDLVESFLQDEEARKGDVYKSLKSELCHLFTLMYGKDITANQKDTIAVLHKAVVVKAGVSQDSTAKELGINVRKEKTLQKACCDVLTSKLIDREKTSK